MTGSRRNFARAAIAAGCLLAMLGIAEAAGAIAVGACGAYGYGYDFRHVTDARSAALRKCTGSGCKIVGVIRRGCAAVSIDAKNPCGSYGWAVNAHLGRAENASLRRCYQYGGRSCVIRAWACDEKG
jgi:hypothetical protein